MRRALFTIFAAGFVAPASLAAPQVNTPTVGAHLAQTLCVQCHAVGTEAEKHSADPQAPRFVDVAHMPSTTELSLKVFLRSSHRNMPDFMLAPDEIDSLTAYVLGLRGK